VISLRNVSLSHGPVAAVSSIDLEVPLGERVALVGPSGSGKTTLLRLVAGLEDPDRGRVVLSGRTGKARQDPAPRGVAMVFQRPALWPHLSVRGNVAFGLSDDRRETGRTRVDDLLERLGLTDLAHRRPHQLSGGEAQRVAIARALAPASPILLLDEPFSDLDAALVQRAVEVVREEVERTGATVLLAAHDLAAAARVCERVAILRAGTLRFGPGSWKAAAVLSEEPSA